MVPDHRDAHRVSAIARRKPVAIEIGEVEDRLANAHDERREVEVREAARRLYAALDRIDGKLRIAFTLAVIDGRAMAEVAELTESTTVAVRTRVWRARRELFRRAKQDPVLSTYLDELGGAK